jgi:hypothetical protein
MTRRKQRDRQRACDGCVGVAGRAGAKRERNAQRREQDNDDDCCDSAAPRHGMTPEAGDSGSK